jgi:hypothetical protein
MAHFLEKGFHGRAVKIQQVDFVPFRQNERNFLKIIKNKGTDTNCRDPGEAAASATFIYG